MAINSDHQLNEFLVGLNAEAQGEEEKRAEDSNEMRKPLEIGKSKSESSDGEAEAQELYREKRNIDRDSNWNWNKENKYRDIYIQQQSKYYYNFNKNHPLNIIWDRKKVGNLFRSKRSSLPDFTHGQFSSSFYLNSDNISSMKGSSSLIGSKSEPPSRPPSADRSNLRPYFGNDMVKEVNVELGRKATLVCKVFELGDKTVSSSNVLISFLYIKVRISFTTE